MSSCSTSDGLIGHQIVTNVDLSQANFKVITSVQGEASARRILGVGINQADLFNQARKDMVSKAGLNGTSRALINVTSEMKVRYGLFSTKKTIYVSAEVIEFTK